MRDHDADDRRHDEPQGGRDALEARREGALDAALAAIPRELAPPAALEERVVNDLSHHGLLSAGDAARWRAARGPGAIPRWAAAAMLAAAAALLMSGYAVGHHMGAAQTAAALIESQKQNAETAVRQAGAAYVAALASLGEGRGPGHEAVAAAVEAQARVAFLAAADQMVRLFPDDPLAAGILRASERGQEFGAAAEGSDSTSARHVVWF